MTVTQSTTSQVSATSSVQKVRTASAYDTSTNQTVEQTDKLAKMQEKYKDVYTPIPETYSKADEDLQQQKIYEAYPNYVSPRDFLKIVDKYYEELGGEPFKLGTKPTDEQLQKSEEASAKAFEEIGMNSEEYKAMMKDVKNIEAKYPYNKLAKDGDIKNATEITRFKNAAVYEGLESGKTLEEAQRAASVALSTWMDTSAVFLKSIGEKNFYDANGKTDLINNQETRTANYDTKWVWDLRKYGIDGEWQWHNIYDNQNAMISEIQQEIGQYNFLLNNKGIVESANDQLSSGAQKQINSYEDKITQEYMPAAQLALKVFSNYNIYDSVDVKA